jgi:hypothetical protein
MNYVWAMTIAGVTAIAATTCVTLYAGAERAGLGRRRAVLLAAGAAVLFGGWLAASAVIAGHSWYHTQLGHQIPWLPIAVVGFLGTLLVLSQLPLVARSLTAPGMTSRLDLPHSFRVIGGVALLLAMALGQLPALFALPAGLGDITAGIAAPFVARELSREVSRGGAKRRAEMWLNVFGLSDLVMALTLGGLITFQLLPVTSSGAAISELPIALIPTVGVPILFTLHITSLRELVRARAPRSVAAVTARPVVAGSQSG